MACYPHNPQCSSGEPIHAKQKTRASRGGPFFADQLRSIDPDELRDGHPVECLPSGGRHFAFEDYLELVDWTGRAVSLDKRGHIAARLPRILFLRGAKVGVLVYRFPCLPSFFTWHTASLAEIEPGPFFSLFLQRSRPPERKDWNDVLCEHAEPPRRPGDSNERD
jgi:hypothetical protein